MEMINRLIILRSCKQLPLSCLINRTRLHTSVLYLNHIRHVPPSAINWYPGHMQKGLKAISSRLSDVDVVIEIHDARIPLTGRCHFVKEAGQIRPHILVMSKTDLAEPITDIKKHKALVSSEESELGPYYHPPAEIFFANLKQPEKQKRLLNRLITSIAQLSPGRSCHSREFLDVFEDSEDVDTQLSLPTQRSINAIVVGLPNCGKSTLINALRGYAGGGGRRGSAVAVGKDAGRTRSVGGPVIIAKDFPVPGADGTTQELCNIRLIDTPGILEPRAQSFCGQLSLAICGAVDWNAVDKILLVDYLLFCLNGRSKYEYVQVFGLPGPIERVDELLAWVAARRRLLCRPGEPDFNAAATHLLRAFNNGALGRITLLPNVDESRAKAFFLPVSAHLYKSTQ